jgi:hypothetical protein
MDYPLFKEGRKYYHKQFIGANNKLNIYPVKVDKGILHFNDDKVHLINYTIYDSYGNKSSISFGINSLESIPTPIKRENADPQAKIFTINGPNFYNDEELSVDIPPFALYDNMDFKSSKSPTQKGLIGPVFYIGNKDTPLQKNITITFKNPAIPSAYKNKTLFVILDENGNSSAMGGKFHDGKMTLRTRFFGKYSLAIDTIKPIIKPVNIGSNKDLSTYNTFSIKISDELSGINKYKGKIDGKWILMEYDTKSKTLTYRFDNNRVLKGPHHFSLTIEDAKGNENNYEVDFIR